jgi:hypothetical protein
VARRWRRDCDSVHVELPIYYETEKAYLVDQSPPGTWLPKDWVVKGEEVSDGVWEFEIPEWLWHQKGVDKSVRSSEV